MVTVATLVQINAPKQSGRTSKARKSNILSTESNHLSISSPQAVQRYSKTAFLPFAGFHDDV